MKDCFICKKHKGIIQTAGSTIYEDDYVYVGHINHGDNPTYLGHIMIDLKRHTPSLADMTTEEAAAFGITTARVSKALIETEKAKHIYSLVSGDSVPHLHMHIIPRYPNTPKEHWGPTRVYDWEGAPFGTSEEIVAVCERLKHYLKANKT
jgi:histidine triad (HIT) family protein